MTKEQLLLWEEKLTGTEVDKINEVAGIAIQKLTITESVTSEKLKAHYKKYGLELEQALRLRYHAQTDLFFLCNLLDKYKDITELTHREVCNFFVQKKPEVKTFKQFATDYQGKLERLLLVPRGGFKSSIDLADCAQWIICYPEITILILCGKLDLAEGFIKELTMHFVLEESGAIDGKKKKIYRPRTMPDGNPNWFQVLFPEHTISPTEIKNAEFLSPLAFKLGNKEVSARAASIEQNLSGWHYDVMKLDDVVTNENSLTLTRIENINKQISVNKAMLNPYGFFDKIGTWYHESDTYGNDIAYIDNCKKDGEDCKIQLYLKAAMWPTEAAAKAGKIEEEMTAADWVLWFPKDNSGIDRLTYKFLMAEKKQDREGFYIKYMNDPRSVHQVKFPRELLVRKTISQNSLPQQGTIVTCIDTAYSTKSWADYTVIMTALIYGGRFFVIDMVRGRFSEYELPIQIAQAAMKWKPKRIVVEDSNGVRWLGREVQREFQKLRLNMHLEYHGLGLGTSSKSKEMKAKPVVRLLGDDRLFFSLGCSGLEELYTELEKFGKKEATHDDICCALSLLVSKFGPFAEQESRVNSASAYFENDPKEIAKYNLIHGLGQYAQYNRNNQIVDDNPVIPMGTDNQVVEAYFDPLSDLF